MSQAYWQGYKDCEEVWFDVIKQANGETDELGKKDPVLLEDLLPILERIIIRYKEICNHEKLSGYVGMLSMMGAKNDSENKKDEQIVTRYLLFLLRELRLSVKNCQDYLDKLEMEVE